MYRRLSFNIIFFFIFVVIVVVITANGRERHKKKIRKKKRSLLRARRARARSAVISHDVITRGPKTEFMRRLRASARVRVRISMGYGRDAKTSRARWHRYITIMCILCTHVV